MKTITYTNPTLYIQLDMRKIYQLAQDMLHIASAILLVFMYFILFSI